MTTVSQPKRTPREALAYARQLDAEGAFGPDSRSVILELADALEQATAALGEIDRIRDNIIGCQGVNWSRDIYPLVAALDEAGFPGEGYDKARARLEAERSDIEAARAETIEQCAKVAVKFGDRAIAAEIRALKLGGT